jgi:hemerythrin
MDVIQWSDSFSVNVAESDRQHQNIIRLINELNDALRARTGKETVGHIIEELISYAQIHFTFEEKCFEQFGYPDAHSHDLAHEKYIDKVFDYYKGFEGGRLGLAVDVLDFLNGWWKNHILTIDKNTAHILTNMD